jgi:hypothetical protein
MRRTCRNVGTDDDERRDDDVQTTHSSICAFIHTHLQKPITIGHLVHVFTNRGLHARDNQ